MGRFVDKNELVIAVILVILLDLNVASGEFIKYIFYGDLSLFTYLFILFGFLIDVSILNLVIKSSDFNKISYQLGDNNQEKIEETDQNKNVLLKIKKYINAFVSVLLLIIVGSAFIVPYCYPSIVSNLSIFSRLIRSTPLLLSAGSIAYFNVVN